ncbi:MAG: ribosome hibernation-promoting factor, HPF/YfiA family [Gammaproteobacteria bacterium]
MNIQISGHNIELTAALKAYIHKKAEKLAHHFSHIISMSVVLNVEREQQIAEANISANNFQGHASATSTDMYQSIDAMLHKLEKQLEKSK